MSPLGREGKGNEKRKKDAREREGNQVDGGRVRRTENHLRRRSFGAAKQTLSVGSECESERRDRVKGKKEKKIGGGDSSLRGRIPGLSRPCITVAAGALSSKHNRTTRGGPQSMKRRRESQEGGEGSDLGVGRWHHLQWFCLTLCCVAQSLTDRATEGRGEDGPPKAPRGPIYRAYRSCRGMLRSKTKKARRRGSNRGKAP